MAITHLAFPVEISGGAFATSEQDTDAEIIGAVDAALLCPRGHRTLLPDFGLPSLEFTRLGADRGGEIRDTILADEPRIGTVLTQEDLLDRAITIGVQVGRA